MKQLCRVLAVLLLAVSVPFQGALAASADECMASPHHHVADDGGGAHQGHQHPDPHHGKHCSPCSACCASAALASATRLALPVAGRDALEASADRQAGSAPLDAPDRPPLAL